MQILLMKVPAYIPIHISEEALISGIFNNDQDCFSSIYDMYAARLFGLILKWVKEKEEAEVLLFQTFIKAWNSRSSFNTKTDHFFHWLCSLARICYNENLVEGFYKKN